MKTEISFHNVDSETFNKIAQMEGVKVDDLGKFSFWATLNLSKNGIALEDDEEVIGITWFKGWRDE